MSKYYKVNTDKKYVSINDGVKPTTADLEDIELYVKCGYVLRHRSKKQQKHSEELGRGYNKEYMLEALKTDPDATNEFNRILYGSVGGFFKARNWFNEYQATKKRI